jgi:hypothetical protein
MATNNKDFKVKHGLIVEGAEGTINNQRILTEVDGDAYILSIAGGGGDSANTPNALVKRDANGDFAAGDITVNKLNIGTIGEIYDDGDLIVSASNDVILEGDDIRLNAADDVRLTAQGGDVVISSQTGHTRFVDGPVYIGFPVEPENEVATKGYVDGAASAVASDLTDHENATEAHGATGAVVGTTNTQTLTNKTISYADNTLTVQVANVSDLTASAAELNTLDGITASTAELNLLDGVTATTAELNLLDGVTATTAELNYVDGVTSGIQAQLDDKAPLASPALSGVPTAPTAIAGTNNTQIATTAYADAAVAALVGSAPDLLNTLQELAAAMDNDPDTINNLQDLAAGKQDTLTAGDNISIDGATISVTGLVAADISDFATASQTANIGYYDTIGSADAAQEAAEDYAAGLNTSTNTRIDELDTSDVAEGTNLYFTNQRAIDAVGGTIGDQIDLLDTDDIEEGSTNLYFTDSRAKASAADLLTGATLNNITITGSGAGLTITAENGVADSTTDELDEGTTNKYFTDARAVTALEAVVPNFTAVEINSVAKQVAATTSVATASQVTAYEFLATEYRSAKFLVKTAQGSHTDVAEVLLTMDSSNNISITEYAMVGTNGSLMTITADYVEVGTTVRLRVTTANNTSVVTVVGTLLA